MTITSTNRKSTNAWEIPLSMVFPALMETFNKHNDQEKKTLVKNIDIEKISLCVYVRYEYTG